MITVRDLLGSGRVLNSTMELDIMFKIWWSLYNKYGQFLPAFMLHEGHSYRLDIPLDYPKISEIFKRFVRKLIVKNYPFVGSEGIGLLLKQLEEFRQLYSLDNLNTEIKFVKILSDRYYNECDNIMNEIRCKKLSSPLFTIRKPNMYHFSYIGDKENNRQEVFDSEKGDNLKTFLKTLNQRIEKRKME